ncbi:hypothetical protein ACVWYU_001782 [Pseudomonas sp. TE12234]
MSIQSMVWALEQRLVEESTARHVLLCLANYADKNGKGAFPSTNSLSEDTGLAVRTVKYKLEALEALGAIRRGNQAIAAAYIDRHDRRPVVYDMAVERGAPDAPRDERGANEDVTGCSSEQNDVQMTTERGAPHAPNPSTIRQLPVNKPKEAAGKPAGTQAERKSSKFDPLVAKPENVSTEAWVGFCEMRKSKRKDLTERACQLIAKKLAKHPDPDAVLDNSTTNSWSDIYPESILPGASTKTAKASAYHSLPNHTQELYPEVKSGANF